MTEDADRWQAHLSNALAKPGTTIVLASADGGALVSQVAHGTEPADLVHIARSLLETAKDRLDEIDGDDGLDDLAGDVANALDCLPDPLAD